ncbi:hypothetical protein CRYUN_Cryun09bG0134800 [Craigia yunnanensis]
MSSCGGKRPRVLNYSSNGTSTSNDSSKSVNYEASTSHQVFRCIQVTAISDGEAEIAYQATVNVSGHVFKGFLYDQGVDVKNTFPCIAKMVFESSGSGRYRDSSSPIVDPPNTFASSGDRANDLILDMYESVASKNGKRGQRFRIEHAQRLASGTADRFGQQEIVASVQGGSHTNSICSFALGSLIIC